MGGIPIANAKPVEAVVAKEKIMPDPIVFVPHPDNVWINNPPHQFYRFIG
jgi:hypothetical protein